MSAETRCYRDFEPSFQTGPTDKELFEKKSSNKYYTGAQLAAKDSAEYL
jgi:hypothetical protein